ncbi:hypothetical protein Clacol_004510 [Clathrus columnatus]|uniref:Uncharacterized protein n=1 Tax=Clathrus columnatus TaxID=1419009 RepID=A0AAV5AC40_9AGAM|nr:hypothetical protein Clacol_004510 [Clathrus columnatus]
MSERHNSHVHPFSSADTPPPSSSSSSQIMKTRPSLSAPTPSYSYSNTFTMRRHDYLPSPSGGPDGDISNYNAPPPPSNNLHPSVSERMNFFSSMSSVPTFVILPDAPSRPLYNYDTLVGPEPSPPAIHPESFVPRRFGIPSKMSNHINNHDRHDHIPQHHNYQFQQSSQPLQPPNPHFYPRKSTDDVDSSNSITATAATEAQLKTLRRRVRELEEELERRSKLRDMNMDMLGVIPPDWEERTRFRERAHCSLNRAGNALCAWHDSRRERPLYASRMAPHRTLNCGCTYEEAIFEESLSRNGVGSLWPGESVRMDPTLRNRLLELLQRVYRYKDGDFERNPDGTWKEGQSAAAWEKKSKRSMRRKRVHW